MAEPSSVAIEARESAKAAHHRLDRMNGSIDRLGDEVAETKRELGKAIEDVAKDVNSILIRLAGEDGAAKAQRGFMLSRRFVISTIAVLLSSSLAAALVTLLLRRHG